MVVVEVRLEGLAAVDDQGNVTAVDLALGLVGGGCGEVFAGNDCGDVGGDLCGGEKTRLVMESSVGSTIWDSSTPLELTTQSLGAVMRKLKTAFRSGCSKFGKTRRQSEGSYWVYR